MNLRIFCVVFFALCTSIFARAIDIRILEANSIEPYAIQSKDFKTPDSGAEIDIFNAVFEGTKYTPQFKFVPLFRVSTDIDEERADGSARMPSTTNSKGYFTDPYIKYTGCVVGLKEKPDIKIDALKKISIIAFQGASGAFGGDFEAAVKDNKQYKEMNNQQSQITLLTLGRIDAIVADLYITRYKQNIIFKEDGLPVKDIKCIHNLSNPPYQAFFKDKIFADLFNVGLKKIIANGTYDNILQKYKMKNELKNELKK